MRIGGAQGFPESPVERIYRTIPFRDAMLLNPIDDYFYRRRAGLVVPHPILTEGAVVFFEFKERIVGFEVLPDQECETGLRRFKFVSLLLEILEILKNREGFGATLFDRKAGVLPPS